MYIQMGRYADGAAALQKSISLGATPGTYSNLGTAYFYDGKYAQAAAQFEKAIVLTPQNSVYWGYLAELVSLRSHARRQGARYLPARH
jgi:tetratricopeptide (TPR) repeat protein